MAELGTGAALFLGGTILIGLDRLHLVAPLVTSICAASLIIVVLVIELLARLRSGRAQF